METLDFVLVAGMVAFTATAIAKGLYFGAHAERKHRRTPEDRSGELAEKG